MSLASVRLYVPKDSKDPTRVDTVVLPVFLSVLVGVIPLPVNYTFVAAALLYTVFRLSFFWFPLFRLTIQCKQVQKLSEKPMLAFVTPKDAHARAATVPISYHRNGRITIEYFKKEFEYSTKDKEFLPLEYPTSLPLKTYNEELKSGGLNSKRYERLAQKFGMNFLDVPIPSFWELFREHAVAPLFVFQILCVVLWMLDEYWYYSLFTLAMFVMFESMLVKRRLGSLEMIRAMRTITKPVEVLRQSSWIEIGSHELLPGDIVKLTVDSAPCDLLLLSGSCVVDESLLTGESIPQMKNVVSKENRNLCLVEDRNSVIFSGTNILLASGKSYGYVLRTGFGTSQGDLIRTILFSTERVTVNQSDSLYFILCLLVFAVLASSYVLYHGLNDPVRDRFKLLLNCVMIITSVVPPELPMELSLAVNSSVATLMKLRIFCTEPFRIPFAGKVDICCFDKTGTLTTDEFLLKGISGITGSDLLDPVDDSVPSTTQIVMAGCNSLASIDKKLVGDPLERAAVESLGWEHMGDNRFSGPTIQLGISQRFAFTSSLKRMTCVVQVMDQSKSTTRYIVMKGAPEVVEQFLGEVPNTYTQSHSSWSRKGCRVLAMAYRIAEPGKTTRENAEASQFVFAGFLVYESPLKPQTCESIAALRESGHRVVMITGDHALTACEVAKQVGISTHDSSLILKPSLNWETDEGILLDFDDSKTVSHDLCCTGPALTILQDSPLDLYDKIKNISVFARVSPSQKEVIVAAYKLAGHATLMCGDGTNDVGALKQAHAGVALLEAKPRNPFEHLEKKPVDVDDENTTVELGDASIAAPFTSKRSNISCCVDVIRQGRCTLVTTLQMYQILAVNCLISAYAMSVLYFDGAKFGDTQATAFGVIVAMLYLFLSQSKSVKKLSTARPRSHVFSWYMLCTIVGQFAIHITSLVVVAGWARAYDFSTRDLVDEDFQPTVLNTMIFLIQVSMTLSTFAANYVGKPFMQSFTENAWFSRTLLFSTLLVFLFANNQMVEFMPDLDMVEIPASLETDFVVIMIVDFVGAIVYQRSVRFLFDTFSPAK